MAQNFQLPADRAELKKFGLLHDLIQIIIFSVPQCLHLEWLLFGMAIIMIRQQ